MEMSLMHYRAGNICNKEIKIQEFIGGVYQPDRIWGEVTRKKGIAGGSTTCLMKIFETVLGRWCPSGRGKFVVAQDDILSQVCQHLPHKCHSLSCLNGDTLVLFKLTELISICKYPSVMRDQWKKQMKTTVYFRLSSKILPYLLQLIQIQLFKGIVREREETIRHLSLK